MLEAGHRILFQGDSITDTGRVRNVDDATSLEALGFGYAALAACRLLADYPTHDLEIHNRGIGGNRVADLLARWESDCIALAPDIVSILIGVNDVWHALSSTGRSDAASVAEAITTFEQTYRVLLERTRSALPQTHLVICEPFTLRCGAVNRRWFPEFDRLRATCSELAREYSARWLPFQQVFDDAVQAGSDPGYWATDGVHPTPAGHQLLADAWLDCIGARSRPARRLPSMV
jgi:lysophospholipase L1-like esterase